MSVREFTKSVNATDVFSLGAILYTMLTGASPFASPSVADSLQKIVRSDIPLLSDVNPEIPDWLVTVFHKCMEKHPGIVFRVLKTSLTKSRPTCARTVIDVAPFRVASLP